MSFKTFKITRLENGYEEISYSDEVFFKKFVTTDEWWELENLPGTHDYFDLKVFMNQLKVYSEEHNNPPVVDFSIGVRSMKLQNPPHIQTHEDTRGLVHLDGVITMLGKIDWYNRIHIHSPSFVYSAKLICKTRKSKAKYNRRKTNIPRGMRHEVFKRDNYTCVECGARKDDGATLHVDHKVPVSKGGTDELDNLQTLCSDCNLNKSDVIQ